jgi:uncharacterized repeat protein (TIGR01451 family)
MKILFFLLALVAPAAAMAADQVTLDSQILVEREIRNADGTSKTILEPTEVVVPGDRLLFVVSYKNVGAEAAADFVVTNPLPPAVAYTGSEGEEPTVSVDGGSSWGQLANLSITQADGTARAALPGDVTHVRWAFNSTIPAGGTGKLSFRGVVK